MKRARTVVASAVAFALVFLPGAAAAQLQVGAQVTWAGSYPPESGATFGAGARVGYALGVLPVSLWGHGDYYFPGAYLGVDTDYMTAGLDAHYSPIDLGPAAPYILAGMMLRHTSANGVSTTGYGYAGGVGVDVDVPLILTPSLEIRREFFDRLDGGSQWTIRLGVTYR